MKEKIKKYVLNKGKCILNLMKKNKDYLVIFLYFAIVLFIFREFYLGIWNANLITLMILSPLLLFFIKYLEKTEKKELVLLTAGIILTLSFFLIQTFEADKKNKEYIYYITAYNCGIVENIISLEELEDTASKRVPGNLILTPYVENAAFIYGKWDKTVGDAISSNLFVLERINDYITTVQNLDIARGSEINPESCFYISETMRGQIHWMIQDAKRVKESFCQTALKQMTTGNLRTFLDRFSNIIQQEPK